MKTLLKAMTFVAAVAICATPLLAQWEKRTNPNVPRLANGQVNLDAPTPKAADGHPDLSGLWTRAPGDGRGGRGRAGANATPRPTAPGRRRRRRPDRRSRRSATSAPTCPTVCR